MKKMILILILLLGLSPVEAYESMGQLQIPSLGLSVEIIEVPLANTGSGVQWDVNKLGYRAGHLGGTAWVNTPGGNIVIAGHVDRIFGDLASLSNGEMIYLVIGLDSYAYQVVTQYYVVPNDLSPVNPTGRDQLTLITCATYNKKTRAWDHRLIVIAERVR